MKVLFCGRLDLLKVLGGDTVQVLETKRALERKGLSIDICEEAIPDVRGYDLVHLFNTQFPEIGLPQIRAIKDAGKPVALSTIYWSMDEVFKSADFLRHELVIKIIPRIASLRPEILGPAVMKLGGLRSGVRAMIRELLDRADVLLPNSVAELEILARVFDYPMARAKSQIVINAVKPIPQQVPLSEASKEKLDRLPCEFVMEAARIEAVKGQLQLLRGTARHCPSLPIVFVGAARASTYTEEVFRTMRGREVFHVDVVPHDELPHFYRRARVHALPSLRESPGLSSLEAAACGSNCVVGVHAPVQEYFGTDAWVCDPNDADSIGKAVAAAWGAPKNANLGARVRGELTWDRAADQTLEAYRRILPQAELFKVAGQAQKD